MQYEGIDVSVAVITGSGGLVGSEACRRFAALGLHIVGFDNDMRRVFFGDEASTRWNAQQLVAELGSSYQHEDIDVRDRDAVAQLFRRYGRAISLVIHAAAQPSHDWAARDPFTDFDINAGGTLNLLEQTRLHAPEAPFIFTSTNKVYGDRPNALPLDEKEARWEIDPNHPYAGGITEDMSVDHTLHSVFGASKLAADMMVQEYGRYFGMATACFRGGTLTGPAHAATELHGFLGYVVRCAMTGTPYTIYGYRGKQVRDAIHSSDLVAAFEEFWRLPRSAAVYNIGGGRHSNVSVLEAIALAQEISGNPIETTYEGQHRRGDHIWWVGSNSRFESDYPNWSQEYTVSTIIGEIHAANLERWKR